jgi:hypothetical protein
MKYLAPVMRVNAERCQRIIGRFRRPIHWSDRLGGLVKFCSRVA